MHLAAQVRIWEWTNFYVILVHGSKMLYLAFKSLTYEQVFNQMTCRVTAISTVKKKLNAKLAVH